MTSEDPPSDNSSPRLSFSHDLIQPDNPSSPRNPANFPNPDFDFNFSIEVAATADELFSDGKILPLPLRNPNPNPDPISGPSSEKGAVKKSLWKLGRSASLNYARRGMSKFKFLRSYSTGSDPNPNPKPQPRPHPNPKPQRAKNTKKGYYFEGGKRGACRSRDGRINPVPLFPKQRGVIGFLLCNCVGGRGMEYYYSP